MNLYLVEQSDNGNYDTFDSIVVVAGDEESAKDFGPYGPVNWGDVDPYTTWAKSRDSVTAYLVGTATSGKEGDVILASFNAG